MARFQQLLFEIVCWHGYVGGQPCGAVHLLPTAACRDLLRRYRWSLRPIPGGIQVYCVPGDAIVPLASFDETAALTFTLCSSDPALFSYTDMPDAAAAASGIHYFDNRDCDVSCDASALLHPPGQPFADGPLRLSPSRFACQAPSPTVTERLSGCPVSPPATAPQAPQMIDLRDWPQARYGLASNGSALYDFFLGPKLAADAWGIVAIYAGGVAQRKARPDGIYPIGTGGLPDPQSYRIVLGERHCLWRYHIVAKCAGLPAPSGQVSAFDHRKAPATLPAAGTFKRLPGTADVNGRASAVFESSQALPLLAVPDADVAYFFQSDGQGMKKGKELMLPYPAPHMLARATADTQQLCADMYVYL